LNSVNSTFYLLFVCISEAMKEQDTDIIWPLVGHALHTIMAIHGFYVLSLSGVM